MAEIRPFDLLKQVAAVPFHFVRHQWKYKAISKPERFYFGRHPRQYLMFWMPPKGTPTKASIVVFYHGGGWRLGWPDQFPTVADWFLRRGFPVIMPAYRLLPRYAFPEMREDLSLAFGKTLELLKARGLDNLKVLPAGMSAGATLAAHLAFNPQVLQEFAPGNKRFSGFLSFGGPLDLNEMPDVGQLRRFVRGTFGSPAFESANPIRYLQGSEKYPVLLVHGTADAIVPFESSARFYEKYPGPKSLFPIPGGSHLDSLGFALHDNETSDVVENWLLKL
jgi:acetyl esterase/lipase